MGAKIIVTIKKKEHTLTSVVEGASGPRCTELTAPLNKAGAVISDQKLPEYFEQTVTESEQLSDQA